MDLVKTTEKMKKIALAWMMAALLFAGCSKEEERVAPATDGVRTLKAVLDDAGTRAAFGEEAAGTMAVNWTAGDQLATSVDGVKYVYRLEGDGGAPTGTFVLVGDAAPASVSEVYYPASALDETGAVNLPACQRYAEGSFDPMACVLKSEVVDGVASSFRGQYAVLCFRLTGAGEPVACVEVDTADGPSATLMCPDVLLGEQPVAFHMVFPAGEHTFTFKVITADGRTMAKTPAGAKTLTAGTLHRLPALAFAADPEQWKAGDYFKRDGKEGIVFSVSEDGLHGKILAMHDFINTEDPLSPDKFQWSTETYPDVVLQTGAQHKSDGMANLNTLLTFLDNTPERTLAHYPAYRACVDAGEGWYLPAMLEAQSYSGRYPEMFSLMQRSLARHGGTALHDGTQINQGYWTSTEFLFPVDRKTYAYPVFMGNGGTVATSSKSNYLYVRGIAAF